MLKSLYLLRHAHAEFSSHLDDIDRPLSADGLNQAKALGDNMRAKQYVPDFVYCSPAKRTSMTLQTLKRNTPKPNHGFNQDPKLYLGTTGDYLNFLQNTSEQHASILLVGHNPSIHELARFLGQTSNDIRLMSYPPCTLTVLSVKDDWKTLSPKSCTLINIL